MTAIAGTVALEDHRLATESPFAACVAIAAVGEVVRRLLTRGVHKGDVTVVPAACTYVTCQEPTAVGTPLKPKVAIAVGEVVFCVEHGLYLTGSEVEDTQGTTVFEEGHLFPVG